MNCDIQYLHQFLSYDEFSSYENYNVVVTIDDNDDDHNNDINEIADMMANMLNMVVKDADKMAVQKMNTLAKALLDEEKEFTADDALAFKKLADEQHLHVILLYAELEENVMKEKADRKLAEEQAAFANALAMALEDELAAEKDLVVEEEDDDIAFLNTMLQEVLHFVKDQPQQPSSSCKRDLSFFDEDEDISFLPAAKRHSPSPQPQFDNDDDFFLFYVPPNRCLPPLLVELNEPNKDEYAHLEFIPLPILPQVSYSPINVPFDKETMLFDFIIEDPEMDTIMNDVQ